MQLRNSDVKEYIKGRIRQVLQLSPWIMATETNTKVDDENKGIVYIPEGDYVFVLLDKYHGKCFACIFTASQKAYQISVHAPRSCFLGTVFVGVQNTLTREIVLFDLVSCQNENFIQKEYELRLSRLRDLADAHVLNFTSKRNSFVPISVIDSSVDTKTRFYKKLYSNSIHLMQT